MKMPSTLSMRHKTSWPQSTVDQEVSLKSAECQRACSKLPSTLVKQPSSPQSSMLSLNWLPQKVNSTNQLWKELLNSSIHWDKISKKPTTTMLNQMLCQLLPSTTKRTELDKPSPDLKPKARDSKISWPIWFNASEPNQLLLKLPQANSKETNNFGIKLKLCAEPSPTNTTMPPKPEETNSNWLLNWKRWLLRDSIKLKTRITREAKN